MNTKLGNKIVGLGTAVLLAGISYFVQWGTLKMQSVRGDFQGLLGMPEEFPVNAVAGTITQAGFKLPNWIGVVLVIYGLLLTITNLIRFSDISRVFVCLMLILGLAIALMSFLIMLSIGRPGLGVFLLIAAAIIGLCHQRRRMSPF